MNNFDGLAETAAIKSALSGLAGGRIFQSLPADESIPRNADGSCKPYVVLLSGTPVAAASGRGMAVSERNQPQNMMWTVNCVAADYASASALFGAVLGILMGFEFESGNGTPLKTFGGFNVTDRETTTAPARVTMATSLSSVINMVTV